MCSCQKGHAARVAMSTPNSINVSAPSAGPGGHYRLPPQKPTRLGYARSTFCLFLVAHVLAMCFLRPLFLGGLCTYLYQDGLYIFFAVIPTGFGFLILWSLSIIWLRRLIRRSRAHSVDRILRYLRALAILVLVVEICWLVVTVGLLIAAWNNLQAYAWKMCFPSNHH